MGHKGRAVLAAAAAITLGLGLSACDDGGDDSAAAQESPAASAPAEESAQESASPEPGTESPAADGGDAAGGDVTAPGTELKVGDRAVVPFEYTSEKKGTLAITVTAIEKGAESDMAPFGAKAKGMTPYFIKMKVENVGGTDMSYASLKLDGVLEGGSGTGVILIGDLPDKCEREAAPADFTTEGASYETCSISATKTAPVVGASFDEGDAYQDEPVVWNAG